MARIKIRYLVPKLNADGTVRWMWQPSKDLRAQGWRTQRLCSRQDFWGPQPPAAVIEAAELRNAELDAWRHGDIPLKSRGPRSGTLDALIARYRGSAQFLNLRASTRRMYNQNLDILQRWAGDVPVRALTADMAIGFYDKMWPVTPTKANSVMRILSLLFTFARTRGQSERVDFNPFMKMGLNGVPRTGLIWPPAAVTLFVKHADVLGLFGLGDAVVLNEWLGQRENDILAMPRNLYRGGAIRVTQAKTGRSVDLPVDLVPHLAARIEAAFKRQAARATTPTTIIVCDATGRAYNPNTFRQDVARVRASAAKECEDFAVDWHSSGRVRMADLWFMHLRHTAITRLAEAGCDKELISSVSGHTLTSIDGVLERYLVRTSKMAKVAFTKRLESEAKGEGE